MSDILKKLESQGDLEMQELVSLLRFRDSETTQKLAEMALKMKKQNFGEHLTVVGRLPVSNHCKYDCNYCALRRSNRFQKRYRLQPEDVFRFAVQAYEDGIRYFMIESGTDMSYSGEDMLKLISLIRSRLQGSHIILNVGERRKDISEEWFKAGATRYMMSHVSADESLFKKLHPSNITLLNRKKNIWTLKEIGFRIGSGIMVGVPCQTIENVANDILFMKKLGAKYVNIVPYLPALHTPFEKEKGGNMEMVFYLMGIVRMMMPGVHIMADISLDKAMKDGRVQAIAFGANMMIIDITNKIIRDRYNVYDTKQGVKVTEEKEFLKQLKTTGFVV